MALLLAPYTNAMRLGQGFNTYTQQICVDDAVIVDPARAENVLTNDGTTMRIMASSAGKPSAWNRLTEVINEGPSIPKDALPAENIETLKPSTDTPHITDQSTTNLNDAAFPGDEKESTAAVTSSELPEPESGSQDIEHSQEINEDAPTTDENLDSKTPPDEPENLATEDTKVDAQTSSNDGESAVLVDSEEDIKTELASPQKPEVVEDTTKPAASNAGSSEVKPKENAARDAAKPAIAELPLTKAIGARARPRSTSTGNKLGSAPDLKQQKRVPAKYQVSEMPARTSKSTIITDIKPPSFRSTSPRVKSELELTQARFERDEKLEMLKLEKERMTEQRAYQRKLEMANRAEDLKRQTEDRDEQRQIRQEKRDYEAARRIAAQKAIAAAAEKNKEPLTLAELDKIRAQNQFADRFEGIESSDQKYTFDVSAARGPSQTVIYSSRFVDKLTDVTDDMMISGALSVKMAKVGGSGKGSFVNSDKFKESDLNFYISVKVTNQTSNFKDALIYNPMRSIDIGSKDFNKVYGDSFISGFEEGGEFNAIISMKIHNKNKLLDIKAEATVALTAGPVAIEATANVGIARTNVEMNTETTIQVSWCGGGHIKPMEQPWSIQSVMQAAARFPQLVADAPQRTYAILTKYESLRSFVSLRPASFTPIQYENAQNYTNVLMEAFMSYKSLYKKLGDQIFSIQNRTLEFEPWPNSDTWPTANAPGSTVVNKVSLLGNQLDVIAAKKHAAALEAAADTTRFEANVSGISLARKFIRRQMMYIVNEVDLIEKDPKVATDEDHEEPFQSPTLFESRLPATKIPDALKPKSDPLQGKRIMAKPQTEEDLERERNEQDQLDSQSPPLYQMGQDLSADETASLNAIQARVPLIGKHLQVSKAMPKTDKGSLFNNLDFLSPEWQVESITIGMTKNGCVGSVEVVYENGLLLRRGLPATQLNSKTLSNFQSGERITSAVIETGTEVKAGTGVVNAVEDPRVLSVCMYSNRGRRLLGQALKNEVLPGSRVKKEGYEYKEVSTLYLDSAYSTGSFKGFFGRVSVDPVTGGILRLGLIWGDSASMKLSTTAASAAPVYDIDAATSEALIDSMRSERDQAKKEVEALATAREERDQAIRSIEQARNQANRDMDQVRADMQARIVTAAANAKQIKLNGISSGRQSISFRNDDFRVKPSTTAFLVFENGLEFKYQPDGNLVVYSKSGSPIWAMDKYGSDTSDMVFHGTNDGNLVGWRTHDGAHWASNSCDCKDGTLVLSSETPFVEIFNRDGVRRWHKP